MNVYISHAEKNADSAAILAEALHETGLNVWNPESV